MVVGRVGLKQGRSRNREAGPPHSHGNPEGSREPALRSTSEDREEEVCSLGP